MLLTALAILFFLLLAKGLQVAWLLQDLPDVNFREVRVGWQMNPLEILRVRDAAARAAGSVPEARPDDAFEETRLRERYGVYTQDGDDIAALRARHARDEARLAAWQQAEAAAPRLLILLTAAMPGYAHDWRRFLSVAYVAQWPQPAAGETSGATAGQEPGLASREPPRVIARTGCVSETFVTSGGRVQAGICSPDEAVLGESRLHARLPSLPAATREDLLLHRVTTTWRRDHLADAFAGIETDVIQAGRAFEVNHPPMRRSGLSLARLLAQQPPGFLWLDFKDAEPVRFGEAIDALQPLLAGRQHLVELPISFFRAGGTIPAGTGLAFSLYVPTKDVQRLGNSPGALAAEINALLAAQPDLDCSFDAALLPWMRAHTRCGERHGIYAWHLDSLHRARGWHSLPEVHASLRAFADARASRHLRLIVKAHNRYF